MVDLFFHCLLYTLSTIIILWICGALFYDVGQASLTGKALAISWLGLSIALFIYWQPLWKPFLTLLLVFAIFHRWWLSQKPSNDRNWAPGFMQPARVSLVGDTITIENVRSTEFHEAQEQDVRYDTRTYKMSEMRGIDALVCYWGSQWMCHPMFIFDFGPSGRVCISIEVRYRVGQDYNFLRSLYRQQELMYVVCEERDAILRRSKYQKGNELYLYRIYASPLIMRQFFLEYASSINTLADTPRWYHGITTNCTTSIYAQGKGRMDWDWRLLFNGVVDRLMYDREILDQQHPFETLKKMSQLNEVANRAPTDDFGGFIRQELPGYQM